MFLTDRAERNDFCDTSISSTLKNVQNPTYAFNRYNEAQVVVLCNSNTWNFQGNGSVITAVCIPSSGGGSGSWASADYCCTLPFLFCFSLHIACHSIYHFALSMSLCFQPAHSALR